MHTYLKGDGAMPRSEACRLTGGDGCDKNEFLELRLERERQRERERERERERKR